MPPSAADIANMERNGSGSKKEGPPASESGSMKKQMIHVAMGKDVLDCPVCSTPLRPPIFQYSMGHFICSSCRDKLSLGTEGKTKACGVCSRPVSDRCHGMERVVGSVVVPCSYADHGCTANEITYYDKGKHEASCPHAPCFCPEKASCGGFAGTAAALLDHFVTQHKWAVTKFKYYVPFDLPVEEAGVRPLRAPDWRLFLLVVASPESPPSLHAVSLVCVEPNGGPEARFGCSLGFSWCKGHYQTTTVDRVRSSSLSNGMPTSCLCVVPRGVMLRVTIDTELVYAKDDELEEEDDDDKSWEEEKDNCKQCNNDSDSDCLGIFPLWTFGSKDLCRISKVTEPSTC